MPSAKAESLHAARRVLLVAGLLSPAFSGLAFDPRDLFAVGAGPVVLHPKFTFTSSYNDNIYFLPDDSIAPELGIIESRDDISFVMSPGFNARLGRPDGDNRLDFDFRFDQIMYMENTSADSSNYDFNLSADVKGSKLSYDCGNHFKYLNSIMDSYTAVIEGIPIPSANVERIFVDLNHNLAYAFSPKTRFLLGGVFNLRDYPGNELATRTFYNSEEWRVRSGAGYALTEKINLDATAHYGQITRDPASDNIARPPRADYVGGSVAANGSITPKLTGRVSVGYEYRWFSNDAEDDGYPIASLSLTQRFTDRTTASVGYSHGGSVSASALNSSATTRDSVFADFQQLVGSALRPWYLTLGVRYVQTRYESGADLSLDNFQLTAGARYQWQPWLGVFANYGYEFGTRPQLDYDVNRVSLGFHLGY